MYFQQGRQIWASYVSVPREVTPGHPGWIWFVQYPGLICLAALWFGPATSAHRLSAAFGCVKACGIRFSSCESFIGFYIWRYLISTILACLFAVRIRISWEKLWWKGSMAAEMPSRASYIVYYVVWRMNLSKLSWNFVWSLRTPTAICRVSFIDFYLVFSMDFRIVFLPHTNTVIFMKPYRDSITEPGLPVLRPRIQIPHLLVFSKK